jgi:hypothetical protein
MRLFVYEECQDPITELAKDCGVTPTKYINMLVRILNTECHIQMTERLHEEIKRFDRGRKRSN